MGTENKQLKNTIYIILYFHFRLCVLFFGGLFVLWSLFYLSGVVAYAAYHDCDPLTNKQIEKPDQIVPFLVADKLQKLPGMAGLFVAAVYGAVLR